MARIALTRFNTAVSQHAVSKPVLNTDSSNDIGNTHTAAKIMLMVIGTGCSNSVAGLTDTSSSPNSTDSSNNDTHVSR